MNLYFPLWIDGGLSRDLHTGARAIRDYLTPRFSFEEVPVGPLCDPALEKDITGYRSICTHLDKAAALLGRRSPEHVFTVGGGCGIEIPIVSYLQRRHGRLKVLWFDAHGDINSPQTSPSKYFHGMPLRFLLEDGLDERICPPGEVLDPADVVLVGTRDLDPPEEAYIRDRGIRVVGAAEAGGPGLVQDPIPLYIHVDLDVLDPKEYPNVKCPARGGLAIKQLTEIISGIMEAHTAVGLSIVENLATDRETLALLDPLFELAGRI